MKYKVISSLLLLPILLTLIVFTSSKSIKLPTDTKADKIVLEHDKLEVVKLGEKLKLSAYAIPKNVSNAQIEFSVSNEEYANIESIEDEYYLIPKKEGYVRVNAYTSDKLIYSSFEAYIYEDKGLGAQEILIYDDNFSYSGIDNNYVYGQYDLDKNGNKVLATNELQIKVVGSKNQNVDIDVIKGNAKVKDRKITFINGEDVVIKVSSITNSNISKEYTFNVVPDGVNVYNYEDLMICTNKSESGEKVVLRTNFESKENALLDPKDLNSATYSNTNLFGRVLNNKLEFDYETIESTYDTTYQDNLAKFNNLSSDELKKSKELKVGLVIKKDFYGNGFTINMHEMCYPSERIGGGAPLLGKNDLFRGPISFVEALGMAKVSGQDNIGTLIKGDNITLSNVNIKNCSNVKDLTFLDYVGTTLEIMGNNVTVKDSIISNGRTVIRSFSNENLLIDNCLVQFGREFLIKAGSNSFIKPTQDVDLSNMSDEEINNFLAPELPIDANTKKSVSDSSITINDTYLYKSGLFSIGIDTHFAGQLLYDATTTSVGAYFPEVKNMAGTSYATNMKITGNTKMFDWKDVKSLDSSTLIQVISNDLDVNKYFNLQELVENYVTKEDTSFAINDNGKTYVHGGIAMYGGGKNYSEVEIEDELLSEFKNIDALSLTGLITLAAGTEPFRFKLYTSQSTPVTINEVPNIDDLKNNIKSN